MKTNTQKKITPLQAAELPTGRYRAGFRIKAQIPGIHARFTEEKR